MYKYISNKFRKDKMNVYTTSDQVTKSILALRNYKKKEANKSTFDNFLSKGTAVVNGVLNVK